MAARLSGWTGVCSACSVLEPNSNSRVDRVTFLTGAMLREVKFLPLRLSPLKILVSLFLGVLGFFGCSPQHRGFQFSRVCGCVLPGTLGKGRAPEFSTVILTKL